MENANENQPTDNKKLVLATSGIATIIFGLVMVIWILLARWVRNSCDGFGCFGFAGLFFLTYAILLVIILTIEIIVLRKKLKRRKTSSIIIACAITIIVAYLSAAGALSYRTSEEKIEDKKSSAYMKCMESAGRSVTEKEHCLTILDL
jgi:uncharacterized membrane protein